MLTINTQKRIANRITLFVIALELVSITVWGSITYKSSKTEIVQSVAAQLHEAALRTRAELNRFFDPIQLQVSALAEIFYTLKVPDVDGSRLLNQLLKIRPEIEEISLVARNGDELFRVSRMQTYGPADLRSLKDRRLIQEALQGKTSFGETVFSEYFEPLTHMAVPLGVPGDIDYVLFCRVNLKWLWTLAQHERIGETGTVYILDSNRSLLAHRDPSLVRAETNLVDQLIPPEMFDTGSAGKLFKYRAFNGEMVTGTAIFEPVNRWWVVVEQSVDEGLAPLDRVIRKYVVIFVLAATVTISLVWFFTRLTLRPLEDFVDSMARIASGERKVRFNTPKDSELEFLAIGFNAMSQALDARIYELEESHRELRESKEQYRQLSQSLQHRVDQATEALRNANAKLEEAAQAAEASNKAKSSFLANMSHELRTPLNAILGYGEILLEDVGAAGMQGSAEDAQRIIHAGNHLLMLINDILDLSKIEAGRLEIHPEVVKIDEVVNEVVETVKPLAAKNNNRFIVDDVEDEAKVIADPMRLRQIIINLLSNAFKFTSNGTVQLTVKRVSESGVDYIDFSVVDDGIGLSPEQTQRIFEPFSQAETTTTRRFGGTGLGLAICKRFCELMNATISVVSVENQGSTFTVRFHEHRPTGETEDGCHETGGHAVAG